VLSNEHFTNFFLENFPQICVGLGERNWGPTEAWLPIDKMWIPGHAGLAEHITRSVLGAGFDPAFSHQLELDHGVMTVYHELDPDMKLPLVPIVQNCAVEPLMPVRRWYEFGLALGNAIRSYDGLERVAVVGTGGLSHFIGVPRVGDIDEGFDRWFLDQLESGNIDELLDLPDDEIELAGNGAHEIRSWLAVAGAAAPARAHTLAYEPIYPWITGMAVSRFDPEGAR
jgi:aromatic ring-opening dioxygenase catalytic subunit (LigB family)